MKNSKKLLWFLSAVLIGIWGTITYQIVSAVWQGNDDEASSALNIDKTKGMQEVFYRYEDDVRDPFRFFIPVEKPVVKKSVIPQQPPVWLPPQYRLTGIIINDRKRTALLEGQDGSVSFLQEGDSVAGIQVLKIREKQVVYSYQKRKGEWVLQ